MKQTKLVVTVYGKDGEVVFSQDPANLDTVHACINLWHEAGNEIYLAFREVESNDINS